MPGSPLSDNYLEQIQAMRQQEAAAYQTLDYLGVFSNESSKDVNIRRSDSDEGALAIPLACQKWREVICDWIYELIDYFDCSRDVVGLAMHFVDRYLSCVYRGSATSTLFRILPDEEENTLTREQFKLLGLASLHLAIKIERPAFASMETLTRVSRGLFSKEQLVAMEDNLLNTLDWRLNPPTANAFLAYFSLPLWQPVLESLDGNTNNNILMLPEKVADEISETAEYMVELSVIDFFFVYQRPSHTAVGAILCSLELANARGLPEAMNYYRIYCQWATSMIGNVDDMAKILNCKARLHAIHSRVQSEEETEPEDMSEDQLSGSHRGEFSYQSYSTREGTEDEASEDTRSTRSLPCYISVVSADS